MPTNRADRATNRTMEVTSRERKSNARTAGRAPNLAGVWGVHPLIGTIVPQMS
jgi:hypothetical protein